MAHPQCEEIISAQIHPLMVAERHPLIMEKIEKIISI
jgi:hypothetical protein